MINADFYYWGDQCPHSHILKRQLSLWLDDSPFTVNYYDISSNLQLAEDLNIYSPNLLIFNGKIRWNGPISRETLRVIAQGEMPQKEPYKVDISDNIVTGSLIKLTEETVFDTYKSCASQYNKECCNSKAEWIKKIRKEYELPCLGLLHFINGECVGGAEFVPSEIVPYSIPREKTKAFLTCAYLSDENADYKNYPLRKLEEILAEIGYKELIAIASEEVVFPNGPLEWFLNQDYEDLGELYYEKIDCARMHLIRKSLI